MERICKYLYYLFLTGLMFGILYLTIVLYIAPRQDAQNRGFIPCTKQLVIELSACERGQIKCPLRHLWSDMRCNVGVIYAGINGWISGKQSTPWANYLFVPEVAFADGETIAADTLAGEMNDINEQHEFIARKHRELEAAKQRSLNPKADILLSDPEYILPNTDALPHLPSDIAGAQDEVGNIDSEADVDLSAIKPDGADNISAPVKTDIRQHLHKVTNQHLQKGKDDNEK